MYQIMIVDDEPSVLEGLTCTIPWDTIDVDTIYQASSSYEALDLLEKHHVDIVITDIRMPGMNGLELIRNIREKWSGIRSIILSGHGEFEYAQEAIRSEAMDYLLKPIEVEDMIRTVKNVITSLEEQWRQVAQYRQTTQTLQEHMPFLRSKVLGDLLQGRIGSVETLKKKLEHLSIPFHLGDSIALLIVRMEEEFYSYDSHSFHLLEYAVCNMTEEIFGKHFDTWHDSDSNGYLIFAVKANNKNEGKSTTLVERLATQLHENVLNYLRGHISVMVSHWGRFPEDLGTLYEASLLSFRRRIGSDRGFFYSMGDELDEDQATTSIDELYRLPTLMHLLDSGNWEEAGNKIKCISNEWQEKFEGSREHLLEVYFLLRASFFRYAHQNGRYVTELFQQEWGQVNEENLRSIAQLEEWSIRLLRRCRSDVEATMSHNRLHVINKAHAYINANLANDVSLQAIADHIHLHPVYLSRLYKQETGEVLSEYAQRIRLDKAAELLKKSELKIYEVAQQTGYEHTYFNRVFKRKFGVTPQEYRDGSQGLE